MNFKLQTCSALSSFWLPQFSSPHASDSPSLLVCCKQACIMHAFGSIFRVYNMIHDGSVISICVSLCQSLVDISIECQHLTLFGKNAPTSNADLLSRHPYLPPFLTSFQKLNKLHYQLMTQCSTHYKSIAIMSSRDVFMVCNSCSKLCCTMHKVILSYKQVQGCKSCCSKGHY